MKYPSVSYCEYADLSNTINIIIIIIYCVPIISQHSLVSCHREIFTDSTYPRIEIDYNRRCYCIAFIIIRYSLT